jgi:hypothetical protein
MNSSIRAVRNGVLPKRYAQAKIQLNVRFAALLVERTSHA